MATVSDVIRFAYREANFKDIAGVMTDDEQEEALYLLQSIVDALHSLVVGIKLHPYRYPFVGTERVSGNALTRSNLRLLINNSEEASLRLPVDAPDGSLIEYVDAGQSAVFTLEGDGNFFGLTGEEEEVEITPASPGRNSPRRWVYREDYGSWLEITDLSLTSVLPFPESFTDYFVTELAIRLTPRSGEEPRAATVMRNRQMRNHISGQWTQNRDVRTGNPGVPTVQVWDEGTVYGDFQTGAPRLW